MASRVFAPSLGARLRVYQRAAVLRLLRRQNPHRLRASGLRRLPRVVARAWRESRAWQQILRDAGIVEPPRQRDGEPLLGRLPVVEKADLFERFSIHELLAGDMPVASLSGVLTSSGHGGRSFAFGLIARSQAERASGAMDLALQQAFDIDGRSTLLVNCLPMGVTFDSRSVCVANVSVREDMALAILRQAGPLFEQVILCIDPLFGKRLLDHAAQQGFDWRSLRVHAILGEETFAEEFRSYLARQLGVAIDTAEGPVIGSSMGVGELGLNLFFETSETIALRRHHHHRDPDRVQPSFFCFNPLRTLVEVLEPDAQGVGDLVITVLDEEAPIPMIRYRTGDRARWLNSEDLDDRVPADVRGAVQRLPMPVIAMLGRDRDRISADWHVDQFKALLYRDPAIADALSGAFRVSVDGNRVQLALQLSEHCTRAPEQVEGEVTALIAAVAQRRGVPAPDIRCYEFQQFPHGMNLDYERKFRYFIAS